MARKIRQEDVPFFWIKSGSEAINDSIHGTHNNKPTGDVGQERSKPMYTSQTAAKAGLREGWTRATFIVREEYVKKLKTLAYWDRRGIKDILDEALGAYLKDKKISSEPPQA